jgi:hypothetical protein
MLAGLAPSSQTVGSNIRVIHEQAKPSSRMTQVNEAMTTSEPSSKVAFVTSSLYNNVIHAKFASR